ncbi:MAG: porin family protein [Bradyrhizobiaceae bacterium]|nr:porin family protein [Bradyrhizobiaceae bacterium]
MRKFLFAGAAVCALGGAPAVAADAPMRAPIMKAPETATALFDWSGFYLGAVAGYGWGDTEHTDPAGGANGSFDANGWLLGGTTGYNWQSGRAVLGVEGDLSWAGLDGAGGSAAGPLSTNLNWLGTGRVRAGYAADAYLFYVTGGAAVGRFEAAGGGFGGSDTRLGWTVGAGFEAKLAQNWSAKLEYLYVDLGDKHAYTNAAGPAAASLTSHIVRVGLNYRF